MPKIIRITTVPLSLKLLLAGQMQSLKAAGWEVLMVSADGKELNSLIKQEGCSHHIIPFTRKFTLFHDLYCLWLLYKLFKKENPDIVHSHTSKAGLLSMIAAKLAGVQNRIHTVAGLPYVASEKSKNKLSVMMEKLTYQHATEVWPNSESLKKFILEENLTVPEKVKIIGKGSSNGVDLGKFSRMALAENHLVAATMRILPAENDFIILAIGNLVKDKGIEELVNAFLQSKITDKSKLVLLGPFEQDQDPLDSDIIRKIQDHPRIIHLEWTDHVAHYMALSDVLVHASHREGFPNVILEAGAMQLPVICSDIRGNVDIITHKSTGLVFPVNKTEILKEALEFAFIKQDYMQQLADNLYEEIKENYQRPAIQQLLMDNYDRLIQKSS
jgi:glycosyltransferase involved in cell wall biosynthesis